jgi:carbon-monoxide dehydrogenase medium subunit
MLHKFRYTNPRSRAELLAVLADDPKQAKLLAGGTDLLVNIRGGVIKPALLIDVKKVRDFRGITWSESEGLGMGPSVTVNDVLGDATIRAKFPLLAECARDLASHQVRNRATVIGNVVNASPCSDMAPALLCLGARAVITSKRAVREVPFAEFFKGVKKTVLQPDEILERVVVPAASAGARGSYRKLKRIAGHDLGIVGVALMKKEGDVKLGISSSAPTPVLVGGLKETDPVDAIVAAARQSISPISDVRCSKEYRSFMVELFVKRLFQEVQ